MSEDIYYKAYEKRYKAVFGAGAERWGHSPEDPILFEFLKKWVIENNLHGKRIVEFACGEGACGVILSKLGCIYRGYDIAPSAIIKARENLKPYSNAEIMLLDMVKDYIGEQFDAALDCMGLHMLVTDGDRRAYLKNAYDSLCPGAPMLFFRESYRNTPGDAYKGPVDSFDDWKRISGSDYNTPSLRRAHTASGDIDVLIPLVPARARDREDYISEFESAGFIVEKFVEMDNSDEIHYAASIYVKRPADASYGKEI